MIAALMKYWPMALVVLNAVTAWAAWSMRQFARSEVQKIVAEATAVLQARDREISDIVHEHGERIIKAEGQITEIRSDILDLPTKADLARVEGEVKAVGREVTSTNAGVQRIEGFFLAKGVERP
ncbi:hypothetical protein [Phenylobacterium ferrooxidans]|uniref:DUF2730 domain-containing protein n=1 Tax=Phenylobacterium ferrooxidans TaxID=2982689 RepID=A0ABW6CNM1_9CAUL